MQGEGPSLGWLLRLVVSVQSLPRSRFLPAIAGVLAVLLASPSLGVGWILDDYYHRTVLLGTSQFRDLLGTPSEMFRFFRGEPARTGRLMEIGLFPWWTDPTIKGEFLQGLTVLTHRLDYALWPDSPALMHAHNLFWLGSAVTVTAAFYRRMMGATWVAGVAGLLFAVDDARGATAGFLANRNVLVAATFGVSALVFHDRWRRDGSRAAALLAPLLLSAALFSKEEGIGAVAYLAAYGLFADAAGRWRGCLALLPHAAVVVAWASLRRSWGYGVRNMGLYIEPLGDAERFAAAVTHRVPILLLGQWGPIPAEVVVFLRLPALSWWGVAAAVLLVITAFAIGPLLRRDHIARFWTAGMLFATIPVAATFPMDRLLTFVGIGAAGLLAQFWALGFGDSGAAPSGFWRTLMLPVAWLFVAFHAILAPIALPLRAANPLAPRWVEQRLYVGTPLDPAIANQTLVIVNAPSPAHASFLLLRRELNGQPLPRHLRVLAPAIPTVTIRRLDERTLAIRPGGGYLAFPLDRLFRSERRPLAAGEQVRLPGMTVVVAELTPDGRPALATFRFDVPVESASLRWLCYRDGGFETFTPPAMGREIEIPFDLEALLSPSRRLN